MRLIFNRILPFPGFVAINIFGCVFARKEYTEHVMGNSYILTHEKIHTAQMRELGYVFFYVIYFLEWIYRLIFHTKTAYRGLSFEMEAYANQHDPFYLNKRKHYAQWRKNS